jgi:DNA-binding transcriptional regulator YdaS (Cro superfamily)
MDNTPPNSRSATTVPALIQRAAELSGGMSALARKLGIARSAPYSWVQIPANRVLQIEVATGGRLSRHTMRPDIYPLSVQVR